ncbi:MAG: transglutaminase-like domain-containing protein [Thermodesulfovibrionales bacterium]
MRYNWDGDLILHDSAIERKRYVIGRKQPIITDIREWMSFEDNIIMKQILRKLREKHCLPNTKQPGDFDSRAMVIWRFIASQIRYVHDTTEYKKGDFWLFPPETFQVGKGDCEDSSFLLASLLIASGISPFCVRVVMGRAYNETNRLLGGHCWPIYKNERGKWCILESTLDSEPVRMPEADALTEEGQPFRYEPLYCFNGHHLWEILPEEITAAGGRGLKKYFEAREKKVNMKKVRLRRGRQKHLKDSAMTT